MPARIIMLISLDRQISERPTPPNQATDHIMHYTYLGSSRSSGLPCEGAPLFGGAGPCQCVLGKRSGQCLLAADLLAADKTVDRHGYGAVDIVGVAVLG